MALPADEYMQLDKMKLGDVSDDGGILDVWPGGERFLRYSGSVLIPRSRLRRAIRHGWRVTFDSARAMVVTVYKKD